MKLLAIFANYGNRGRNIFGRDWVFCCYTICPGLPPPPGLERLELELALFVLHQQLDFFFDLGQFLVAELDQADPFFEGGQRIFERQVAGLELLDDPLQLFERGFISVLAVPIVDPISVVTRRERSSPRAHAHTSKRPSRCRNILPR
jgi:hypothetical protein